MMTPLLRRMASYHSLAQRWVDDEAKRPHVETRLLEAAFFYLSAKDGASGPLGGQSRTTKREPRPDTLPARLKSIGKAVAGIAKLVQRGSFTKRAQSNLSGCRRRLLDNLCPPAADTEVAAELPPGSSLPFTPDDLEDGDGDSEIINALCPDSAVDEPLLFAHVRTLVESVNAEEVAQAASWVADRTVAGTERNKKVRSLTVRPGHSGDRALESWLDSMLTIWQHDLGLRVATSVGAPGTAHAGEATGPLIRFLMEAGEPLGIRMGTDAWRRHVRDALAIRESKNI